MRGFLSRVALFIVPLLLAAGLVLSIDPMGFVPRVQLLPPIGHMARVTKVQAYEASPRDFDLFILGSSRSIRFDADEADHHNYRAFNFAVFNSMMEDSYAITRLILDRNKRPVKRILLGLDPTMLQADWPVDWRVHLVPELDRYLHPNDRVPLSHYAGKMVQTMARNAIRSVLYNLRGLHSARNTAVTPENGNLLTTPLPPQMIQPARIASVEKEYMPVMQRFHALGKDRLRYLDDLVALCDSNRIDLTIFLTPLHPELDSLFRRDTEYGNRIWEIRQHLATLRSPYMQWVDFSVPSDFDGSITDFTDGAHIGSVNSSTALDSLLRMDVDQAFAKKDNPDLRRGDGMKSTEKKGHQEG